MLGLEAGRDAARSRPIPRGLSYLTPLLVQLLLGGSAHGETTCGFSIRLLDTTGLEPRVVDRLVDEAASIFAKTGVELTAVRQSDLSSDPQTLPRVVILQKLPAGILNVLHRISGHKKTIMACILPPNRTRSRATIYLSRTTVEAVAQVGRASQLPPNLLARALGRVLAHELAHLVLGPGHSDCGILKPNFSRKDLTSFDGRALRFSRDHVRILRSACLSGRFRESVAVAAAIK